MHANNNCAEVPAKRVSRNELENCEMKRKHFLDHVSASGGGVWEGGNTLTPENFHLLNSQIASSVDFGDAKSMNFLHEQESKELRVIKT
jgi:hypothetical protein